MRKLIALLIVVTVLAVWCILGYYSRGKQEVSNQAGMTTEECTAKGGGIVNILDDKRAEDLAFRRDHKAEFCNNTEAFLGDVSGLKCPCICCRKLPNPQR